jgi:hypothetical protein
MTLSYKFIDCTNQLAEAEDSNGNKWMFLADDTTNPAQQVWANTYPLPEITICNDPVPADSEDE